MSISRRKYLATVGGLGAAAVAGWAAAGYLASNPVVVPVTTGAEKTLTVTETAKPTAAEGQPIEIAAMLQVGGMGGPGGRLIEAFNAAPERAIDKIKVNTASHPWEAFAEKFMVEAIAKTRTYAIEMWNATFTGLAAPFLEDMTPFIEGHHTDLREISEALLARGGWKGKVIGLPWRVGTENLCVYRKDLFEKYGVEPPDKSIKSLDDLVEVARKLNHPPDHYATALALAGYKATDTEFERYFWDLGGRIVNEDETDVSDYDRNAPLAVKLIETWKTLIKEKLIPAGAVGEVVLDKLTDYMQGKVAMFMEYSARAQVIEDPASSKVPGLSGWTLIFTDSKDAVGPRGSYSYGWLIGINPNSTQDEKEAAYKVCEWFVSFEAQYKAATQYANAPVRTDVLTDSAFAEGVPSARANAESMKTAYGMRLAEAPKIEKIVADEVDAAIAGKKETEDAVSEIWKQVHALLKPG